MDALTDLIAPRSAASDRCERLCRILSMPDGGPVLVEGHHKLILRAFHAPGRRETVAEVPKGNGKTTIFGAAGVEHLLTRPNAQLFIGAADAEQAGEMYRFMHHFGTCHAELEEQFAMRPSTRRVLCRRDQGFARVLASDSSRTGGKRQAFNPTQFLIDELHAHENPNLYVAGRSAIFKNPDARMGTLTTAGHDPLSVLGRRRGAIRAQAEECGQIWHGLHVTPDGHLSDDGEGRLTVALTPTGNTVMLEWSCRGEDHELGADDLDDSLVVKLANPASFVTLEGIDDARESLEPWIFARYRANVWTVAAKSWIPPSSWTALRNPEAVIPPGSTVVGAVDMARYRDTAAVVIRWNRPGQRAVVKAHYISPPGTPDDPVDYEAVKQAIRDVADIYRLQQMGFDPKYFDQAADELLAEDIPMVLMPQSNERMCPASADLRQEILAGELEHDGDSTFARHVAAGVAVDIGEGQWKLAKSKKSGPPIDALIALVMAGALAGAPSYDGPLFEILT